MRSRPAVTAGGSVREGGWGRQGRAALGVAGCAGGKEEVPLSQAVALRKSNFSFLFFLRGVGGGIGRPGLAGLPASHQYSVGLIRLQQNVPLNRKACQGLNGFLWRGRRGLGGD